MNWIIVAQLLATYGPEITNFIIAKVHAGKEVTPEEWSELFALTIKTPQSQFNDALSKLGLSADLPEVKALQAMLNEAR